MANHVYFNIEVTSALTEGQWNESFHQEKCRKKDVERLKKHIL